MLLTLFVVSVLVFLAFNLIPGDPATRILGTEATENQLAMLRQEMGLNDPLYVRYFRWVTGFIQGDLGTSYTYGSVSALIIYDKPEEESTVSEVPIEDIVTYSITDKMTIELKGTPGDSTTHYAMVSVFFSMDSSHPDYKKYGATMGDNEVILKSIIGDVFSNYTLDEARLQQDEIRNEILKKVQNKYSGSNFVFDVSFSDIVFQ